VFIESTADHGFIAEKGGVEEASVALEFLIMPSIFS